MARVLLCLVIMLASIGALKAPLPRRGVLRVAAAALVAPALPAPVFASKTKMKDATRLADAAAKLEVAETTGLKAGSAGKGLRGTASSSFESSMHTGIEPRICIPLLPASLRTCMLSRAVLLCCPRRSDCAVWCPTAGDTVQRNRDLNGGLARDASGKKISVANRSRSPEELGLKQWDGS